MAIWASWYGPCGTGPHQLGWLVWASEWAGTSSFETSSTYSSSSSSSTSSKALEAMLVAMAEGVSSHSPVPIASRAKPFAWVHKDVLDHHSKMPLSEVASLLEEGKWVHKPYACQFAKVRCGKGERVCHAVKAREGHFRYMYETVLLDLAVTLPFDFFEADVLRMLGIAPSQLHPNRWKTLQAFKVVCLTLAVIPSALAPTILLEGASQIQGALKKSTILIGKGMLKKQGVDMVELIRKARLTNDVRSTLVIVKGVVNVGMLVAPTEVEVVSANAEAEKPRPADTRKMSTHPDGNGQPASTDPNAAKRKAEASTAKEAAKKKGKIVAPPPPPVPPQPKGKVIVTSGPEFPLGGLSCYVAPPTTHSLWGPGFGVRGWFPPNHIPQHDRGLLVFAGADNSFDMITAYMTRSMATLEILAKEAINKKEFKKEQKASDESRVEAQKLKKENQKARVEVEKLKDDLLLPNQSLLL
ncbi:hypothetical protein CR513_25391, partial [Mucuna pruriens]